jgi:hypothetical protein
MAWKPAKPTHRIKAKTKGDTLDTATIGVAWLNENMSMTIRLNVGVTIAWNDELVITAFPVGDSEEFEPIKKKKPTAGNDA